MKGDEEWHCYLLDYDPAMWFGGGIAHNSFSRDGLWLHYHGSSIYGWSCIVATNMIMTTEVGGAEGRGVYTTPKWEKASHYSVPHRFPGSNLFTKVVMLVAPLRPPSETLGFCVSARCVCVCVVCERCRCARARVWV